MAVADFRAGIDGRLSSSPSGEGVGSISCTLDALHRPVSGQSWPILDLTLGEFPEGLCRFSLAWPSWCRTEYALPLHRMVLLIFGFV